MHQTRLRLRDLRRSGQPEGRFDLQRGPIRVGRGPRCEIRLHADGIADVQVILRRDGERWLIHPVGPAEGCLFNGRSLTESQLLQPGSIFTIGHVELSLDNPRAEEPEASRQAPEPVRVGEPVAVEEPLAIAEAVQPEPVQIEPIQPLVAVAPEPPAVVEPVVAGTPVAVPPAAPMMQFEPSGLLADLARRAIDQGRRRQSFAGATPPVAAKSAIDTPEPMPLGAFDRLQPTARSGRSIAPIPDSLNEWAQDFSRRYRTCQPSKTSAIHANDALGETGAPFTDSGYRPRPLSKLGQAGNKARLIDSFLDLPAPAAAPIEAVIQAVTGTLVAGASFESISAQTLVNRAVPGASRVAITEPPTDVLVSDTELAESFRHESGFLIPEVESWVEEAPATVAVTLSETLSPEKFEEWIESVGSIMEPEVPEDEESVYAVSESEIEAEFNETDGALFDKRETYVSFETDADECDDRAYEAEVAFDDTGLEIMAESVDFDEPVTLTAATIETTAVLLENSEEPADPLEDVAEEMAAFAQPSELLADSTELEESAGLDLQDADHGEEATEAGLEGHWPSVNDIMRWSADRENWAGDQGSEPAHAEDHDENEIAPKQMGRVNLPIAIVLCLVWLGASTALLKATISMSRQDDVTQQAISAIDAVADSGGTPRLPARAAGQVASVPAWWATGGDQLWWRATYLKMRERNGQAAAQSSDVLASAAIQRSPLLPQGRVWSVTKGDKAASLREWAGLSRDVVSMIIAADHYRRIGDDEKAAVSDRTALELVSGPDRHMTDRDVVFDAELGTGRFLLPHQQETLAILKRLVKEANAPELIVKIMPENRPVVWLTAAQFLKQSGLGDPEPILEKILSWKSPPRTSLDQQRLGEAVRAEALALQGKTVEAAEIYKQLAATAPESVWMRACYFNHGELSQRNQKPDVALVSWRKARGDDPNHEVDRHAIQASRSISANLGDPTAKAPIVRAN